MTKRKPDLPIVAQCNGCGVCCFHMGYPPFVRPFAPLTEQQIDCDENLKAEIAIDPLRRAELEQGRSGEEWWHRLPDQLRIELDTYIASYERREYGDEVSTFDGPCFWFDMETRHCKHHQHRPNVCRDFETGSKQCHEWRRFYQDRILLR